MACIDKFWLKTSEEKLVLSLSSVPAAMQSAGKLLPPQIHEVVLEGELERKGRVIIIGDVHGCIEEMKELLVKAEYIHGVDTVILVGDLGDKGPKPLEVGHQTRECCMGSHLVFCLQWSVLHCHHRRHRKYPVSWSLNLQAVFCWNVNPSSVQQGGSRSVRHAKAMPHAAIQGDAGG